MKENDLTYELICAAVNGEKTALEEILRFYDDYINALATVKGEDAQGKTYRYIDEDLKARIQLVWRIFVLRSMIQSWCALTAVIIRFILWMRQRR